MDEELKPTKESKKKKFFSRLVEKIERKMAEKAKASPRCCSSGDNQDNACCG